MNLTQNTYSALGAVAWELADRPDTRGNAASNLAHELARLVDAELSDDKTARARVLKEIALIAISAMPAHGDRASGSSALQRAAWIPLSRHLPTLDDTNPFEDIEWSDGKDIWQGHYQKPDKATHWRPIVLPQA